MTIRIITAAFLATSAFISQTAFADAPAAPTPEFTVTGSAAIVSQYRFRGIAQSNNLPAVQGSITVSHKSGFYVAMWGSSGAGDKNADFTSKSYDPKAVSYVSPNGGTEIDVYGGYTHGLGKSGLTIDVGGYGYIYPSLPANNLYEVYGSLTKAYGPLSAKVGVYYAPKQNYFTLAGTTTRYNVYEYGELTLSPTTAPIILHAHVGHTGGGLDVANRAYIDYTVGASYKWKSLVFDISAVGTNIRKGDITRAGIGPLGSVANRSVYRTGFLVPVFSLTANF